MSESYPKDRPNLYNWRTFQTFFNRFEPEREKKRKMKRPVHTVFEPDRLWECNESSLKFYFTFFFFVFVRIYKWYIIYHRPCHRHSGSCLLYLSHLIFFSSRNSIKRKSQSATDEIMFDVQLMAGWLLMRYCPVRAPINNDHTPILSFKNWREKHFLFHL